MCLKIIKEAHFGEIKVPLKLKFQHFFNKFQVFIVFVCVCVWKEHNQGEEYCNNTIIPVAHTALFMLNWEKA